MSKVTIRDVAKALDLTVGTVSKALNGKSGISAQTRERVEEAAHKMGYNANRLAQGLARHPILIGIIIPKIWQEFYGYLRMGIDEELASMIDHKVYAKYTFVSNLSASDEIKYTLDSFLEDGVDAVIVCPAFDTNYEEELEKFIEKNIPVIILGNKMDSEYKTAAIYSDSFKSGSLAADFASSIVDQKNSIAVFIGRNDMWDHAEKVRGFFANDKLDHSLVLGVYETFDRPKKAYDLTLELIEDSDLRLIYVATGNSVAVCKALKDCGKEQSVDVIATDLFPQMQEYVAGGIIKGIIFQDPIWQGKKAVSTIYECLTQGLIPPKDITTFPHFVLRSNFNDYLHTLERKNF